MPDFDPATTGLLIAQCRCCGTAYTLLGWAHLHCLGAQRSGPDDPGCELRTCGACRSTLALSLPPSPVPSPPDLSTRKDSDG